MQNIFDIVSTSPLRVRLKPLEFHIAGVLVGHLTVPASGMSASGQDPKGLEAKPASPTAESGDAQ